MPVCIFAFASNFVLFIIKLYVGLSCNSISIYSDGINNMLDGFSALITAVCLGFIRKRLLAGSAATVKKTESLLSLVLSTLVLLSGAYFAYTSLERLIYPTPIWFSMRYLYLLVGTALFKLVMFLVYRIADRRLDSQVVKIMSYDCILDFFITAVTIISLWVSARGSFSLDAFCGLFISGAVIIGGMKVFGGYIKRVIGFVPSEKRETLGEILASAGIDAQTAEIFFECGDDIIGYISFESSEEREKAELLYDKISEETGIVMKTVIK